MGIYHISYLAFQRIPRNLPVHMVSLAHFDYYALGVGSGYFFRKYFAIIHSITGLNISIKNKISQFNISSPLAALILPGPSLGQFLSMHSVGHDSRYKWLPSFRAHLL